MAEEQGTDISTVAQSGEPVFLFVSAETRARCLAATLPFW